MRKEFWARLHLNLWCRSAGLGLAVFSTVGMIAMMLSLSGAAVADDGLETQKGGLFHRKGWISPEIYRKQPSSQLNKSTQSQPKNPGRRVRQRNVRVAGVSVKPRVPKATAGRRGKAQSQKSRSARTRNEPVKTKQRRRAAAKRRIPKRLVKRRERKLRNAAAERRRVKVASLGLDALPAKKKTRARTRSVTGGGRRVSWVANRRCVPGRLVAAINFVARNFGRVRVNSTCRSRRHNRRVGGASRSWHLKSKAADIRVFGNIRRAARYLRGVVGGFKHYGGGRFHLDTGPRRTW